MALFILNNCDTFYLKYFGEVLLQLPISSVCDEVFFIEMGFSEGFSYNWVLFFTR